MEDRIKERRRRTRWKEGGGKETRIKGRERLMPGEGRKFRSKTIHNPFLRWTEQDDAALIYAFYSLASLSYP